MRKILPPLPFPHIPNLVDSDLCAVAVTRAADEGHLPEKEPVASCNTRNTPAPSAPSTSATWADAQGGGAGMRIDNEEFKTKLLPLPQLTPYNFDNKIYKSKPTALPLPQLTPYLPAQTKPSAPETTWWRKQNQTPDLTPTRIVMEGHSFWRKKPNGKKVQEWVFRKADARKHKVCVVLEHHTGRLYTSFLDAQTFWKYYSEYKGRRCFYWINRSHGQKDETSLLHFDIEWLSATAEDDPTTQERLQILKVAIEKGLPKPCKFTWERLGRLSPKGNHEWKNSWHLYAEDIIFKDNAQGSMRDFVRDKVWNKIKAHPLMRCPVKGKPILDLGVYTKNRCWRVPGSTKGAEWPGKNEPLPEKNFFMLTRMSDRRESPTFSASELGIIEEPHCKRKLNPNPTPNTTARRRKKRGRSRMTSNDNQATHKRRNQRQALAISAMPMFCTDTPGPDPGPTSAQAKLNSNQSSNQPPQRSRTWMAVTRRHDCPITGCDNWGGKGYKDSTIIGHMHTHTPT